MKHAAALNLVASDWDGTLADTFEKSPNGVGVEPCYRMALRDMFGSNALLDDIGGLQNRASAEVIAAVLELDAPLARRGCQYAEKQADDLKHLVPPGKGIADGANIADVLTETLVRVRLRYLLPEIDGRWPKPYEGVLEFLETLERQGKCIAIITAGHDMFVQKTFHVWGVKCPKFIVTDDDLRSLKVPHKDKYKPSGYLWQVLDQRIRAVSGLPEHVPRKARLYVGDCPQRDRGLAWNGNVRFAWFNPERKATPMGFGNNEFQFTSWKQARNQLLY